MPALGSFFGLCFVFSCVNSGPNLPPHPALGRGPGPAVPADPAISLLDPPQDLRICTSHPAYYLYQDNYHLLCHVPKPLPQPSPQSHTQEQLQTLSRDFSMRGTRQAPGDGGDQARPADWLAFTLSTHPRSLPACAPPGPIEGGCSGAHRPWLLGSDTHTLPLMLNNRPILPILNFRTVIQTAEESYEHRLSTRILTLLKIIQG